MWGINTIYTNIWFSSMSKTAIVGNWGADVDLSIVDAWDRLKLRLDAVRGAAIVVRERRAVAMVAMVLIHYGCGLCTMVVVYAAFGAGGRG